ncbi:hypothetical protein BFW87_19770 [Pseudomonas fluorescens]|uniref:KAP NTPase domain-containing protein n=1 Tax=Pseudomonas fluorescens TaxID=294 RepID=A0A1T2YGY9_PSEFL|nr:P-loop NTPase fold protein [Pseudomonas fluorescens]OPA91246.1 hypothetical protein BFW87_19770 [Pseudomonas fluorescens]
MKNKVDLNRHVNDFLEEYFSHPTPPQYAIMLKGAWGSGKTWFTKKAILKLREHNRKELYISLYGINSFTAIEEEFFKQLHPILSSKHMGLAGKLLKGVIKGTIKIDLDEKPAGSANIAIPDIRLPDYLTNTTGLILIFDDLERCSIPINDLLGYINHFVEHQDYKVVIIANEDEILLGLEEDSTHSKQYIKIKEKLIGKTFQIQADLDSAINEFRKDLPPKIKSVLEKNHDTIKQIYTQSKFNNLRHLKQAFWDFARLYNALEAPAQTNEPLITNLLQLHLAFSIEIRHGAMEGRSIPNLRSEYISYASSHTSKNSQPELPTLLKLKDKYTEINFHTLLIEASCWSDMLDNSILDEDKINKDLKNSTYLVSESTPNWIKLWHFHHLSDAEFETLCITVFEELSNATYMEPDQVKHVAGIFISCSEKNIFDKPIDEILEKSKNNIDLLKKTKKLLTTNSLHTELKHNESSYGLQYHALNAPSFLTLNDYIKEKTTEAFNEQLPGEGAELLKLMKKDALKFSHSLSFSNATDTRFLSTPILHFIEPSEFLDTLTSLDRHSLQQACYFLSDRYQTNHYNESLTQELAWLKTLKKQMRIKILNNKGKLTSYILENISTQIDTAITQLSNYQKPH